MSLLLLFVGSYLLGGIPVGVLVTRMYGIDIMKVGSGSIGATNVSRALGKKAWVLVFLPDVLKGVLPTVAARMIVTHSMWGVDPQAIWFLAGVTAVVGHCVSPFLGFRGGKGVATALGAGLGASPIVALMAFAVFGVVLAATRYMAIASTIGVGMSLVFGMLVPHQSLQLLPFYAVLTIFVAVRHRTNFSRLAAGTEPKFGRPSSA